MLFLLSSHMTQKTTNKIAIDPKQDSQATTDTCSQRKQQS